MIDKQLEKERRYLRKTIRDQGLIIEGLRKNDNELMLATHHWNSMSEEERLFIGIQKGTINQLHREWFKEQDIITGLEVKNIKADERLTEIDDLILELKNK